MSREWNSAEYARLSNPQLAWGLRVLDQLELRGDERVLDAGCGSGRVTTELLQRLPRGRLIALDLSFNMAASAATALGKFAPRIGVVQADLLELPLATASLDVVFSTAVFHWVRDHDRLFAEIFRALRPGGRLHAQCGGGQNLARLRERALAIMSTPRFAPFFVGWSEPWEYPDAPTTAERLRRAGFADIEAGLHAAPTSLPNARDFQDFQATVTLHRHLARLPNELRTELLLSLAAQYAKDDPPFTLDYWRLDLRGRKPE